MMEMLIALVMELWPNEGEEARRNDFYASMAKFGQTDDTHIALSEDDLELVKHLFEAIEREKSLAKKAQCASGASKVVGQFFAGVMVELAKTAF